MALSAPTLMIVAVAFAGGAAATQMVPNVLSSSTAMTAPAVAQNPVLPAPAGVAQVASAAGTGCADQVWPYVKRGCAESAPDSAARQVRVISTDRGAPRSVPLPEWEAARNNLSASAEAQPVAVQQAAVGVNLFGSSTGAVLPPARPATLSAGPATGEEAVTSAPIHADIDVTSSTQPVREPVQAVRAPVRTTRQVAHAQPARVRVTSPATVAQADDEADAVAVYRTPDGRQIVVRSGAELQEHRRRLAAQGFDLRPQQQPRSDDRRHVPETVIGWLGQSSDF